MLERTPLASLWEGERWERCQRQIQRPERVAAVGVQRRRSVAKAHTGYRNRMWHSEAVTEGEIDGT